MQRTITPRCGLSGAARSCRNMDARIGRSPRTLSWGLVILAVICTAPLPSAADDWPQWGGPQRDLVWRETGIVKEFPDTGLLPRVWSSPVGEGYSGPAVAEGRVYITDRLADKQLERVLCLDAETGIEIWKHEYPSRYTISYPAGPRSTPVVNAGRVYTVGAVGQMFCFDAANGKILWQKDFVKDFGTKLPNWGMVASPLVDGDQLITLVGGEEHALVVSFDKATGKELWRALDDGEVGYAPPVIFTFGGVRQLIVWHPAAVSSLDPASGQVFWEVPFPSRAGLTIATPRQYENRLFVTTFYNGPLMLEVEGKAAKILWKGKSESEMNTDGLHSIISTPYLTSSHIYGVCSYGQLRCLDAGTGKRLWETFDATGHARWWNAFIIPYEDRYFLHNEQGDLIIARLSPDGYREISRAKLVEPTRPVQRRMTIWSHPAFAMRSVFARNDKEIVRVDLFGTMSEIYDSIVLGVGGFGSGTLDALARRGQRVLGIERFDVPHDRGSSHGETRIIRKAYFEHPDYVPLLLEAYRLWEELDAQTPEILWNLCGLMLAGPPEGEAVAGARTSAQQHGLDIQNVARAEAQRRFPGFRFPEGFDMVFEPQAGYLHVERCVSALVRRALANGAVVRTNETAVDWHSDGKRVRVHTDKGNYEAARMVITAGPWAAGVLAGLHLPLTVVRKPVFWCPVTTGDYNASAGAPAWFFEMPEGQFYGFPSLDDQTLKLAQHTGGDTITDPTRVDRGLHAEDFAPAKKFLERVIPGVIPKPVRHSVCMYTLTPDRHFIIDVHPDYTNVAIGAGFSGHGYKFTTVLGEALADLVTLGSTTLPVEFLSLKRRALAR